MRTKKGRRSEPFWPSIVMKKWLNIKPKIHDFSEDEVDTETESEDDDIRAHANARERPKMNQSSRMKDNRPAIPSQAPEIPENGRSLRHRRRKSETLRIQYINTKDLRVTIGTWNVAGKVPCEDLEVGEWLCMKEPADMYILGFQEVIPLNAGNVLGAEDKSPASKWEAIIRRTLNTSLEPEMIHRSYSAPPSPELRSSFVPNSLADEMDLPVAQLKGNGNRLLTNVGSFKKFNLHEVKSFGTEFQIKSIGGVDSDSRLDWPEYSLDAPALRPMPSKPRLRRVLSSSGRNEFDWMEKPLILTRQYLSMNGRWRRDNFSCGNLNAVHPEPPEDSDVFDSLCDVPEKFSDEDDDYLSLELQDHCDDAAQEEPLKARPRYVRIVGKQMVGIYVSVWVRRRLRKHVNNLKVSPVGVGIMGYMGNKGSISVSMSLYQTRLCFVCSHLTSGHKIGDQQRRNCDVYEILKRTRFSSIIDYEQPKTIPSHDQIFWFGDLNYRINMLDENVRGLVARKLWDELINSDQLYKELRSGHVFDGWKEGLIQFPPTYKYEINSDRYIGESPKEGEKKRSPAWCDRILWLGKGIKQLHYGRAEQKLSDHRPVSAIFLVEVEVFNQRKLQRALNLTNAEVHPENFPSGDHC